MARPCQQAKAQRNPGPYLGNPGVGATREAVSSHTTEEVCASAGVLDVWTGTTVARRGRGPSRRLRRTPRSPTTSTGTSKRQEAQVTTLILEMGSAGAVASSTGIHFGTSYSLLDPISSGV